jgi:hypothetical protein
MRALLLFLAAVLLTAATQPPNHAYILPGKLAAEWTFHEESRVWLSVESANHRDWPEEGFHPSHTYVLVKDYKPVVKQVGKEKWQITFTSPIAEELP